MVNMYYFLYRAGRWESSTQCTNTIVRTSYFKSFPASLSELQNEKWLPLIEFVNKRLGTSVMPSRGEHVYFAQSDEQLSKYRKYLEGLSAFKLAAFEISAAETKSFVIPFALMESYISVNAAVEASYLEHKYQEERWGSIEGGRTIFCVYFCSYLLFFQPVHDLNIQRHKYVLFCCKSAFM